MGARKAPLKRWSDEEKKQVEGLLTSFNGDRETVCAVIDCSDGDLDALCLDAFGIDFDACVHKYELIGKARLKSALFKSAEGGNAKAIDMLAREHLDMGATLTRKQSMRMQEQQAKAREVDF